MSRGDRREAIFADDQDRQRFLETFTQAWVKLAGQLRSQTAMPLAWSAERLSMGSRGYLAWLLGSGERGKKARHPQSVERAGTHAEAETAAERSGHGLGVARRFAPGLERSAHLSWAAGSLGTRMPTSMPWPPVV